VTRTEYDGAITVLIDKFDGKPLNSPNDIVVKSDGSIWFTDPRRASPATMKATWPSRSCDQRVPSRSANRPRHRGVGDIRPNGLCFTPDERKMYIVDFSNVPRLIRVYDVVDNGAKLAAASHS